MDVSPNQVLMNRIRALTTWLCVVLSKAEHGLGVRCKGSGVLHDSKLPYDLLRKTSLGIEMDLNCFIVLDIL